MNIKKLETDFKSHLSYKNNIARIRRKKMPMYEGLPGQLAPLSQVESGELNQLETARVSHANPIITSDETRMPQVTSKSTKASGAPKLPVPKETNENMDEVKEVPSKEDGTPMAGSPKKESTSEKKGDKVEEKIEEKVQDEDEVVQDTIED